MSRWCSWFLLAALLLAWPTSTRSLSAQTTAATLPPLVYVCPMHPEQVDNKAGACPVCKMKLEPARIDAKWWCPTHQTLEARDAPGKCRRDGRDLVPVTLREFWTCPDSTEKLNDPGACAGTVPRRIGYELRAHGDHNPRHGGQFFMAEDQWHHLEGTYPSTGLFRVYVYDNFSRPMDASAFSGALVLLDASLNEVASYSLTTGADRTTLEAKIPPDKAALPLNAAIRLTFVPNGKPQLFNFPFTTFSRDPSGTPNAGATTPTVPFQALGDIRRPRAFSFRELVIGRDLQSQAAGSAAVQTPRILDRPLEINAELADALNESALPVTVPELLKTLTERLDAIKSVVSNGNLGEAWLPAMASKTVVLALDGHSQSLARDQRALASAAARSVVTCAWEIDTYGDLGDLSGINDAVARMTVAVRELKELYADAW